MDRFLASIHSADDMDRIGTGECLVLLWTVLAITAIELLIIVATLIWRHK